MYALRSPAVPGPVLNEPHVSASLFAVWKCAAAGRQVFLKPEELVARQFHGFGGAVLGGADDDVVCRIPCHRSPKSWWMGNERIL